MRPYLDLLQKILDEGTWQENRTGTDTLGIFGSHLRFDLTEGFPAVTTRKLAFKTFIGEMVGFMRATQSAADFRALGCKFWDQNANENKQWLANPSRSGEDALGRVYGVQWRQWRAYKTLTPGTSPYIAAIEAGYQPHAHVIGSDEVVLFKEIDQLRECLDKIMFKPSDRRILFHAWNPAELDEMALPPCHLLYMFQVNQTTRELNMLMFQRSVDTPLGLVGNLTEAAAMLSLFARLTGYTAKWLQWFGGDTHIYENELRMVLTQLQRTPKKAPRLVISDRVPDFAKTGKYEPEWLDLIEPSDFSLEDYDPHSPLTAAMSV